MQEKIIDEPFIQRRVPWLTIAGLWLREAGFESGDIVQIEIGEGVLIISNKTADANGAPVSNTPVYR